MTEQSPEPQLYTLAEAKIELARVDCEAYGHQWQVADVRTVDVPAGYPVEVKCNRCPVHHAVVQTPAPEEPPPVEPPA